MNTVPNREHSEDLLLALNNQVDDAASSSSLESAEEELFAAASDGQDAAERPRRALFPDTDAWLQTLRIDSRRISDASLEDAAGNEEIETDEESNPTQDLDASEIALAEMRRRGRPLDSKSLLDRLKRAKEGDQDAVRDVVYHILPLIVTMATDNYKSAHADLVGAAMIKVLRAINKCSTKQALYFNRYVLKSARHAMNDYVQNDHSVLHVPDKEKRLARQADRIRSQLGSETSISAIAEKLDVTAQELLDALAAKEASSRVDYIDELENPADIISAQSEEERPEIRAEKHERAAIAKEAFLQLSRRSQLILSLRLGIGGQRRLTREQIGRLFQVSAERIRQIEVAAQERCWKEYCAQINESDENDSDSTSHPTEAMLPRWQDRLLALMLKRLKASHARCSADQLNSHAAWILQQHPDTFLDVPDKNLEVSELSYFLKSQLLARGFIREAFGGSEVVLTAAGLKWLTNTYAENDS